MRSKTLMSESSNSKTFMMQMNYNLSNINELWNKCLKQYEALKSLNATH